MGYCCYEDINKGKGICSPCLKPKGHSGEHVHEEICRTPSCLCRGFEIALRKKGLLEEWVMLKDEMNKLHIKVGILEEKVKFDD